MSLWEDRWPILIAQFLWKSLSLHLLDSPNALIQLPRWLRCHIFNFALLTFYKFKRPELFYEGIKGALNPVQGSSEGYISRNMPEEGHGVVELSVPIWTKVQPILKVQHSILSKKVPLVLPTEGCSFLFCFFFLTLKLDLCLSLPWALDVELHWDSGF